MSQSHPPPEEPHLSSEAPPQEAVAEILPEQTQETTTETVQPVEPEPVQPQAQEIRIACCCIG